MTPRRERYALSPINATRPPRVVCWAAVVDSSRAAVATPRSSAASGAVDASREEAPFLRVFLGRSVEV